jgi:pyruvate/2-oxoglutarate dehydrogenase complex dihydrolipoamide dehydrogenase (E3) component
VLGGGYIGCELGQMFRRFGAEVTMLFRGRQLLPREDPDVAGAIEAVFRAEGIDLVRGAEVARVSRVGKDVVLHHDGASTSGSHLLVAVGRRPNTDDLGCDLAGVVLDRDGYVVVDDFYRSSADGVYAVGDVAGGPQFTHTAWDDHRRLFELLEDRARLRRSERIIPYTVFTDPQVARVGLSEKDARRRGPVEVATMPFGEVARAIETDETAGVMKVILDPADERILGVTLVGADAGELLHVFVPLLQSKVSARAIVDAEFVHPTFAEGLQSLVMRLPRYALF